LIQSHVYHSGNHAVSVKQKWTVHVALFDDLATVWLVFDRLGWISKHI